MTRRKGTTTFGALLENHRRAAGLTREVLAERAGMSAKAIGALERGERRSPYRETVRLLAKALDLGPEDRSAFEAAVQRRRVAAGRLDGATSSADPIEKAPTFGPLPPLINRHDELAKLELLLDRNDVRLVTLTGTAGVGKTRLAQAVIDRTRASGLSVTVVDLAMVRDPDLVLTTVADRLRLAGSGGTPLERLIAALKDRFLLMVLDNFEQVLPAASELPPLLAGAPGLKLLVTSRASLGLRAEHVILVPPLALPDPADLPPLRGLAEVPSVALFLQRARSVSSDFAFTDQNARAIAELCVHLDGLPLAIELAAARTTVLSPEMILERLSQRLSLLRWDSSDLPERQQTLGAAIGWSYDLLTNVEQSLFRLLSVFVGSFAVEAAEAIASDLGHNRNDVLGTLTSLVAKSLVVSNPDLQGERRLRLLESIREYALEQLAAHGEEEKTRRAHAIYYVVLAERMAPELIGRLAEDVAPELAARWQGDNVIRLEQEQHNLRAALEWLAGRNETELELRLAIAVGSFWCSRGQLDEARGRLEPALARSADANPGLRLRAMNVLGLLLAWQGQLDQAEGVLGEALSLARSLGNGGAIARSLAFLGQCSVIRKSWDEANRLLEEALSVATEAEDAWATAFAYYSLGCLALLQGHPEQASPALERAVSDFRSMDEIWLMVSAVTWLGRARAQLGDLRAAVDCFRQSLRAAARLRDPWFLYICLARIAAQFADKLDPEQVGRLVGAIEHLHQVGVGRMELHDGDPRQVETSLIPRLGQERFKLALAAGRTLNFAQTAALVEQVLDELVDGNEARPQSPSSATC